MKTPIQSKNATNNSSPKSDQKEVKAKVELESEMPSGRTRRRRSALA